MTSRQTEIFTIEPAAGVAAGAQEIGFKAYNLARMASVGLPVPQAVVLGTRFCRDYFKHGHKLPPDMRELLCLAGSLEVRSLTSSTPIIKPRPRTSPISS